MLKSVTITTRKNKGDIESSDNIYLENVWNTYVQNKCLFVIQLHNGTDIKLPLDSIIQINEQPMKVEK